jgi:hypothetical protein
LPLLRVLWILVLLIARGVCSNKVGSVWLLYSPRRDNG